MVPGKGPCKRGQDKQNYGCCPESLMPSAGVGRGRWPGRGSAPTLCERRALLAPAFANISAAVQSPGAGAQRGWGGLGRTPGRGAVSGTLCPWAGFPNTGDGCRGLVWQQHRGHPKRPRGAHAGRSCGGTLTSKTPAAAAEPPAGVPGGSGRLASVNPAQRKPRVALDCKPRVAQAAGRWARTVVDREEQQAHLHYLFPWK